MTSGLESFRLVVAAALLLSCIGTTTARAEENVAKAKQLYDDGVTDYNLGHYQEALQSFESGYRLKHDASFLFNIAQCQRLLSQYENARRSFQAYLRESPKLEEVRRAQVEKLIAQMEQAIDEERNRQPATGTVPSVVSPAPATPHETSAPPSPAVSKERGGSTLRLTGIALGSFGVAAIIAGGVFYAVAKSANDTLNRPSDGVFSEAAQNKRNTFQTLDIVAFAVGGAAVVTGVSLYVAGWRRDRRSAIHAGSTLGHPLAFEF